MSTEWQWTEQQSYHRLFLLLWCGHSTDTDQRSKTSCPVWWRHHPWSSVWGLRVLPITQPNSNQCVCNFHVPWGVLGMFYLHTQTTVDAVTVAPGKQWLLWLREHKPQPPISAQCQDKDGTGSGISSFQTLVSCQDLNALDWLAVTSGVSFRACEARYISLDPGLEASWAKWDPNQTIASINNVLTYLVRFRFQQVQ